MPGTRPLFAASTRSARSSSSLAFRSSCLSSASRADRYSTPSVITASNATASVKPMVVRMLGGGTPSASTSASAEPGSRHSCATAEATAARSSSGASSERGPGGGEAGEDAEARAVARGATARDESCARIKASAAPREAVGATRRGARCAGRVAATRARRERRDARTEAGARTAAGARTEAMTSAIANAAWQELEISRRLARTRHRQRANQMPIRTSCTKPRLEEAAGFEGNEGA